MASTPADKPETETESQAAAAGQVPPSADSPGDEPKAASKAEPKAKGRKKASKAEPKAKGLQILTPLIHESRVIEPGSPLPKGLTEDDLKRLKRLGVVG